MKEFAILGIGIAILLIAVVCELNTIFNHVRVRQMSLCDIEHVHPRLPRAVEVTIALLMSIALLLLFLQFIRIVYAFSFSLSSSTAEQKDTVSVVMGDFDGDGDLDYIAGNSDGGTYNLDLYKNNGAGTFTNSTFGTSINFKEFSAGDIDGDGDLDLVAFSTTVLVKYVNDGAANFTSYAIDSGVLNNVVLVDVNNDGSLDVIVSSSVSAMPTAVYLNNGHGVFTAAASTLPAVSGSIAVADVTNDGYPDLILGINPQSKVYVNSGTGAFVALSTLSTASAPNGAAFSDIDGDGDIDVITSIGGGATQTFFNNGNGSSFSFGASYGSVSLDNAVASADLDNDGDQDFIIAGCSIGSNGGAEVFINSGGGTFSQLAAPTEGGDCVKRTAIGDIDGDTDLDYVRGNRDYAGTAGQINRHYKSDQAATSANTAPTAPTLATLTGTLVSPTPKSPSAATDDTGVGTVAWTNPSNVFASDNSYVSAAGLGPGSITHYLKATGFGFSIPTSATILGIKVEVERKAVLTSGLSDHAVRIVKGGTIGSTDRSLSGNWPLSDAYTSYGSGTDLWGTTWTASDINASNFGFALSVHDIGIGGTMPNIDHIRITIYYSMRDILLSWGSGSDTQSPTNMLQYQLKVGTGSASNTVLSGITASPNWVGRVMPNGQSRTMLLKNLPCGSTYYWSVAAVDTGFRSTRSSEQTLTIASDCSFSGGGGGGGGGGSTTTTQGGGSLWRIPHEEPPRVETGYLLLSAFEDINGNGTKDLREKNGFAGLLVTASGSTASGTAIRKTIILSQDGTATLELEKSDDRGYRLLIDTGSVILRDYHPTGSTLSGTYIIRDGSEESVAFSFRRNILLDYKPCLAIAPPLPDELVGSDALVLLQRLEDAFSLRVTDGIHLKASLMDRLDYFTLLQRTQCIEEKTSAPSVDFIDLASNPGTKNASLVSTLLAAGLPVARTTSAGLAVDLSSPITRAEAIHLLVVAMKMPPRTPSPETTPFPTDLTPTDALAPDVLSLSALGILPESFFPTLGPSQGMTPTEVAILLTRASFRSGHIGLLPVVFDQGSRSTHAAAPAESPSFLTDFPVFIPPSCLERIPERSESIHFTDLLPGDSLESSLRSLLARGTKNSDGKMLWLLPATKKPTEFGIMKGTPVLTIHEPVSMLEVLRDLLVLRCLPPPSAKEALLLGASLTEGSGESRVSRDRISDLPRDTSFVSRVLYRAQDREKEFDLSLFTYAPHLLSQPSRKSDTALSVKDGADLLASGLLNLLVHGVLVTPQAAENKASELSMVLRKQFLDGAIDDSIAAARPLTRSMLLTFLATVLDGSTPSSDEPSLAETWWTRVRD